VVVDQAPPATRAQPCTRPPIVIYQGVGAVQAGSYPAKKKPVVDFSACYARPYSLSKAEKQKTPPQKNEADKVVLKYYE